MPVRAFHTAFRCWPRRTDIIGPMLDTGDEICYGSMSRFANAHNMIISMYTTSALAASGATGISMLILLRYGRRSEFASEEAFIIIQSTNCLRQCLAGCWQHRLQNASLMGAVIPLWRTLSPYFRVILRWLCHKAQCRPQRASPPPSPRRFDDHWSRSTIAYYSWLVKRCRTSSLIDAFLILLPFATRLIKQDGNRATL